MAVLLLCLVSSQSCAMQLVVSTGDVLADGAATYSFDGVGIPRINNHGQVAFFGRATTPGGTILSGVWSQVADGSLKSVATSLESAPGVGTHEFYFQPPLAPPPVINDQGQTGFHGTLSPYKVGIDAYNDQGFWSEGPGGELRLVLRENDLAPLGDGTRRLLFNVLGVEFHFNAQGQTLFLGGVQGNPQAGIWKGTSADDISLVAATISSLLNVASERRFVVLHSADLNDVGQVAFTGIGSNGVRGANGVWRENVDGDLVAVARQFDAAPGTAAGTQFSNLFLGPDLNNRGEVAFIASTNDSPGQTIGVWTDAGSEGLRRIAQSKSEINGIEAGVTFSSFQNVMLGDGGHVVFNGTLQGSGIGTSNGSGIWKVEDGNSQLLARLGEQAPGTPVGTVFEELGAPLVNSRGQVVFDGRVVDSVNGGFGKSGIWAQDVDGEMRLVALQGDVINVSDDPLNPEYLQLGGIWFYDGQTGGYPRLSVSSSGFNDQGQIAFQGMVADLGSTRYRSAVLIANINGAVVPEPAGVVLVAMGIVTMMAARRWRR